MPVYSDAEKDFSNKYSKETVALMNFIKSRHSIVSKANIGMQIRKRNQGVENLKRARSMQRLRNYNKAQESQSQVLAGDKDMNTLKLLGHAKVQKNRDIEDVRDRNLINDSTSTVNKGVITIQNKHKTSVVRTLNPVSFIPTTRNPAKSSTSSKTSQGELPMKRRSTVLHKITIDGNVIFY